MKKELVNVNDVQNGFKGIASGEEVWQSMKGGRRKWVKSARLYKCLLQYVAGRL
jgi:hypothetical protein